MPGGLSTAALLHYKSYNMFHQYLITVENKNLSAKQASQRLDGFCLARACRAVWVSSKPHVHALGQS